MRKPRTPQELKEIADHLANVSRAVGKVAEKMETAGVKDLLSHGEAQINRYVPALRKWAASLEVDLDTQIAIAKRGKDNHFATDKKRSDTAREKRRVAKKPR